jgi:S1-C subfamily serine protease
MLGEGGVVTGVVPGGQAEGAGVPPGAVLLAVNGSSVWGLPQRAVVDALAASPRPLSLSFSATTVGR